MMTNAQNAQHKILHVNGTDVIDNKSKYITTTNMNNNNNNKHEQQ